MSRKRLDGEVNAQFAPTVLLRRFGTGFADAVMAEACSIFGSWHKRAGNKLLLMIGKAAKHCVAPCVVRPLVLAANGRQGPTVSSTG